MTRLRALLLALVCAWPSLALPAAPEESPGAAVRARMADAPVLRGGFEQEKRLQGFRNPLRSSGDFLLARDRGVVWNTRQPFASSVVLTDKQLFARQPDGRRRPLFGQDGSRGVAMVNTLMMALLAGDVAALAPQFDIAQSLPDDRAWRLVLVPRDAALKKAFARIELQGDRHVRLVVLEEVGGDRTEIRFLDLRDTPAQLDAAEAAQFD